jgi:hypothetical protein
MRHFAKIRFIATAGFAIAMLLSAQAQPPSNAKESASASISPMLPAQQASRPAEISYTDGKLFVSAHNSSLNQILHDISRQTGMKITGRVAEERVFGQYGPAAPSQILGTLLEGTGSNMLLLQATATAPAELILTPRNGGPTPPDPNAAIEEPPVEPPMNRPPYIPAEPQPAPAQPAANTTPAPATSQPGQQSPGAPKTPQQIYEQLQRLRQQQQQQANPR